MTRLPDHVSMLERALRDIFANRLQSIVAYGLQTSTPSASLGPGARTGPHSASAGGARTTTMALVESLTETDLKTCAGRNGAWHAAGLATPLLLTRGEFLRSLDAFPLEFSAMIADHDVVTGSDPFEGLTIDTADVRRACEVQVRSHLLHLREGFLETQARGDALAVLIVRSATPFAALLTSVARLQGLATRDQATVGRHAERELQIPPGVVTDVIALAHATEISAAEAMRIFPAYLDAAERLAHYVDGWSAK